MPYTNTSELPKNIKDAYSDKAQQAFMAAWNNIFKATSDEARAFAGAHSAARKVDGKPVVPAPAGKPPPFGGKVAPPFGKAGIEQEQGDLVEADFAEASMWLDATFAEAPQLDEATGVHRAKVTVIKPGISANGFYYSDRVLSGLVPLIEGAKAYIDHETKSEIKDRGSRSVKDLMGWYSDVYQGPEGEVRGMLNFAPGSERIVEMLRVNPSLVGLSINAKGRASRGEVGGRKVMIAEAFDKLYSTDIVTEAAAGGEVTRMVASVTTEMEEEISEVKESMAEEDKLMADWLIAEQAFEVSKRDEELSTIKWLAAEADHNKERKDAITEAVKELPEAHRDYMTSILEKLPTEEIEGEVKRFVEVMKNEPPEKKNDTPAGAVAEGPKPGEEGYQRRFLG